ncbi:MAG: Rne/Rng family ribonuclease [Desulforegulaceae bacterium]|nr:Rne/Rng family ribonuclease [Desulforegulaceae bacterium]
MEKELIINASLHETRVALLENGVLSELFIERGIDENIVGSIYKGKIQRVLPGMQAAFVEVGLDKAAFLYVDDVVQTDNLNLESEDFLEKFSGDLTDETEDSSGYGVSGHEEKSFQIQSVLSEGQEIVVQVSKGPMGTKGARVTTHISIPGRYLVLMPTINHIGISRRIGEPSERERLKKIIESERINNYGFILRTAAEGIEEESIIREMKFLEKLWKSVVEKNKTKSAPVCLHRDLSVTLRAVRDLLTHEVNKVVIDIKDGYKAVKSFLKKHMVDFPVKVELFQGKEPIFDAYNIEIDIQRALKKKVWLKSGGYIIIEHTEALVAIDVNTGRYVGKHNFEQTILKTNLEAVKEIAYQVRLRNLCGIIIVDFIDMEEIENQERVFRALKEALKKDKTKTYIVPMTELGLIQMTRKRERKSLNSTLCQDCQYCEGRGFLNSGKTICYNIVRDVKRKSVDMTGESFTIRCNPEIASLLHGEEAKILQIIEDFTDKPVVVYPVSNYFREQFDIIENLRKPESY